MNEFKPTASSKILDVGGTLMNWNLTDCDSQITLLNLHETKEMHSLPSNFSFVTGNGIALQYTNEEFDICYSNSVIEHVGSLENQAKFADETRRVGRSVWVQTPARSFFFEPHLLTPFVHFFPISLQHRLLRNFTVWGWLTRPTRDEVEKFLSEVRLLNFEEMRQLFPDCEIRREKFLGLTKAYIAVRN